MSSGPGRTNASQGCLEKLPIEIVFEIFTYLEPKDILHLSRTTKPLRNILLSKDSRPIWRVAFHNFNHLARQEAPVPPLPFDLNEPQYAKLLFDRSCEVCFEGETDNVGWACRFRCHKGCMEKGFFRLDDLKRRGFQHLDQILQYVPTYNRFALNTLNCDSRIKLYPYVSVKRIHSEYQAYAYALDGGTEMEMEAWGARKTEELRKLAERNFDSGIPEPEPEA
ncbi:hypothetical protein V5O48_000169 [Marasmius crinis-equi]|uniref:F-box domain-containing protein n=1 Tax=Marasmius crinis-equi TaxID=585013 RepID=A0ABR3G2K8_9AGAR